MPTNPLRFRALPRRTLLLGSLAGLAACAVKPVLLDRASLGDVKRIGLPDTGFPSSPTVNVTNGIGQQLGAIGMLTTAIVMGNRSGAVTTLMAAQRFDPHAYFAEQLAQQVQADGFTVLPQPGKASRSSFLDTYAEDAQADAMLDVFVSSYGFTAHADTDDAPYRPAVTLSMRLVHARDRAILMQDEAAFLGIDAPLDQPGGAPAPIAFTSFSDVTGSPARALAALRGGLAFAAAAVGKRLA